MCNALLPGILDMRCLHSQGSIVQLIASGLAMFGLSLFISSFLQFLLFPHLTILLCLGLVKGWIKLLSDVSWHFGSVGPHRHREQNCIRLEKKKVLQEMQ